jgi:putative ABC transport system permease protein
MSTDRPPKVFLKFFRWYCHPKMRDYIEGDLMEVYERRQNANGTRHADIRFVIDVLLLFRPGIIKPTEGAETLNSWGMYKNYLIIGWRNLWRNKGYSFINISGLALGITVTILIGLWVVDEWNFNKSFKDYDRIASVYHHIRFGETVVSQSSIPYPMGQELRNGLAEFDEVVMASDPSEHIANYKGNKFSRQGLFVEPRFAEMFSLQMIEGTSKDLKEIHSVLLARSLAKSLADQYMVGKMIKVDGKDNFLVSGVFEDFPANSQFSEIKMLLPMEYYLAAQKKRDSWDSFNYQCFVRLNENALVDQVNLKIRNMVFNKSSNEVRAIKPEGFLFPMEKWHLNADFNNGVNTGGRIRFVWMFGLIGSFVLILACINFTNLSTARSEKRSKEVGVRKVMGSVRNQLIHQFLSESFLIVIISFISSLVLSIVVLPWFNLLADKNLSIPWNNVNFYIISIAFILLTGLLAGSYPALYLSSFSPVKVLKGSFKVGKFAILPRKALVVFQFTVSIALIIGTAIIFQQIQHAKDRPVGFDREGIIQIGIRTEGLARANYNLLREEMLATGVVENMAKSDFPITGGMNGEASLTWAGKDPTTQPLIAQNTGSHDFPATNGFQFIEGRDFSRAFSTDTSALVINEMAANLIAPGKSAIGMKIKFGNGKEREVVGVIKDQIRWTPFTKQSPHIYGISYSGMGYLTVRLKAGEEIRGALTRLEAVLKKYDPDAPFDYKFQDDDYARMFKEEERVGKLAGVFATLAIFVSCIGIFGLAAFAASQRTKEIGIRKVLGASIFSVWKMLSSDFVWLVVIALVIATPIMYYFSNSWLEQYEYRIEITWWIFALVGIGALLITLLTVSYQSIKAAITNPVQSLRSE